MVWAATTTHIELVRISMSERPTVGFATLKADLDDAALVVRLAYRLAFADRFQRARVYSATRGPAVQAAAKAQVVSLRYGSPFEVLVALAIAVPALAGALKLLAALFKDISEGIKNIAEARKLDTERRALSAGVGQSEERSHIPESHASVESIVAQFIARLDPLLQEQVYRALTEEDLSSQKPEPGQHHSIRRKPATSPSPRFYRRITRIAAKDVEIEIVEE